MDNPAKINRIGTCTTCGRGYGRVAGMLVHLDALDEYEVVNDHGVISPQRAKNNATRIRNGTYDEHFNNNFGSSVRQTERIKRKYKYGDFSTAKARRDARLAATKNSSQP